MFREECKKIFVKQHGIILFLLFLIGELILLSFCYQKNEFQSPKTEQIYNEYMKFYSGELTAEKEQEIIAEQENIVNAKNEKAIIIRDMRNNKYDSEQEFQNDYIPVNEISMREDAFNLVLKKYTYAKDYPANRYMMSGNYDGMTVDMPDFILIAVIIYIVSALFLNEERSNMIWQIRILQNGRKKTYISKIFVLVSSILFCSIIRFVLEFVFLLNSGTLSELSYPIQSINFFSSCPYNCSIIVAFLIMQIFRIIGVTFISSLIIILSSFVKKSLPVIFIPCALLVLQQFSFYTISPAYYLPTGLLRAVCYFKGDEYATNEIGEKMITFEHIPISAIVMILICTVLFIIISSYFSYRYYQNDRKRAKIKRKKMIMMLTIITTGIIFTGCSNKPTDKKIAYNLYENSSFAQNKTDFFLSGEDNIRMISKSSGNETHIVHDIFDTENTSFLQNYLYIDNDYIYFMKGNSINGISLSDFHEETFWKISDDFDGFLGVNFQKNQNQDTEFVLPTGFFLINGDMFQIYNNKVEKNGKIIIDDTIFGLSCDGKNIYYINHLYQLICYNIDTEVSNRISGEFVKSVYFDGENLLYSDKDGLFLLSDKTSSPQKISNFTASNICSDGENIIFDCNGILYLAGYDKIVYEGIFTDFSIISELNELIVINNSEYEIISLNE